MRLRRYQSWAIIDDGDGHPLRKPLRKHITRRGAEAQANSSCYDTGLQLGLLMAKVYHGVEINITPEVSEIVEGTNDE